MMHLVCIGLSHKTAPVEQREKAALSEHAARSVLRALVGTRDVSEAVALSTCNRTEIYAVGDDLSETEDAMVRAVVDHTSISRGELDCARYLHLEERAAGHLFRVASSLDSMVLGESEIQAQVRGAWELAQEEETSGVVLNHLFRQAIEAGKRVRHETRISEGPTSVAAVAVQLAREAFGDLPRRRALLVGAGQVGEATARSLVSSGLRELVVANRTVSTARTVADKVGGRGVGFDRIGAELETADIVISSTDAPHPILFRDDIARVMAERPTRPLILIDIAVPRDLDPRIGEVKGAVLYDIDDLERVVEASISERAREAQKAETIIGSEMRRFAEWRHGLAVAPTISSLRERAEEIRRTEMARIGGQLDSLSAEDLERVEALTKAIVNKLLHEPTVRARAAAQNGEGLTHVEVLRHLFDLRLEGRADLGNSRSDSPASRDEPLPSRGSQ
jgi:glutamyl-tRNA reductase